MVKVVLAQVEQNLSEAIAHDRASSHEVVPESIEIVLCDRVSISMSAKPLEEITDMWPDELSFLERSREKLFHFV